MNTLIALRKAKGMTQNDVAHKLGITRQAYGHYESGVRLPPTDNLEKLAILFGVSTDYLLGIGEAPEPARATTSTPISTNPSVAMTRERMMKIAKEHGIYFTNRHIREMVRKIEALHENLGDPDQLMLSGSIDPANMTEEDRYLLAAALEVAIVTTKAMAIKTFTPKRIRHARSSLQK